MNHSPDPLGKLEEISQDIEQELNEEDSEVQRLTWAVLDEQITSEELKRLEQLLLEDEESRSTYISCIQMHVELKKFFARPSTASCSETSEAKNSQSVS